MNEGTRQRSKESEERARESGEGGPLPTEEEVGARKRSSARSGRDAARARRKRKSGKGTGTPVSSPRTGRPRATKGAGDVSEERSQRVGSPKVRATSQRSPSTALTKAKERVRRRKRSGSQSNAS